ncbi:MAG: tryptophan synthase subunit alpha [Pseudomonadota bacterium]
MSSRIEEKFADLAVQKRKALITFVMGGDPNIATSKQILASIAKAGSDIIEIGMPFSDPTADGATIQSAGLRSLQAGTKLKDIIALVEDFRKSDPKTPIILMGYYNPVYSYGVEKFCIDASNVGVDGVILVDLPPEEEAEFVDVAKIYDLKLIRLIAPTTDDDRLAKLAANAGGFLYYISIAGVTGTKSADISELKKRVEHIKSKTKLPVAVGFGIRTPAQAQEIAAFSDGVVVGSALVELLNKQPLVQSEQFVKSFYDNLV